MKLLVEGNSMRTAARFAEVSINTVTKLLVDAGKACHAHHHRNVRNVTSNRVELDEIWGFVYAKNRNVPYAKAPPEWAGSIYTWTAIDPETKLLITWLVGSRELHYATLFMEDLEQRLAGRVQLTSDGWHAYPPAIQAAFGDDVDYSRLVKVATEDADRGQHQVIGNPDLSHATTSLAERFNLTLRMQNRRLTRKTNAFSKRVTNYSYQMALYTTYYNWCRKHLTLKTTPAVAAGLADQIYDVEWIVSLVEARDSKPGPRGPYKKRDRPQPPEQVVYDTPNEDDYLDACGVEFVTEA